MSELQLGLLAIGALVIAGVLAYNRRQERAARRAAESSFRSGHADVLLDSRPTRVEPAWADPQPAAARAAAASAEALPDPRIDYVVELSFPVPVATSVLAEHWKANEHLYAARAILACSGGGGAWRRLAPGDAASVDAVRAGLQLVSREGAVNEARLIEFRAAVETLAAATGATVSAPEIQHAVDAARELDRFCGDSDIQVVFHVTALPQGTLPGSGIRAVAEASGLALEDDGRFALRNGAGQILYALSSRDGSRFDSASIDASVLPGISLSLDVPRVPDLRRSFESMARFAAELAGAVGGSLVDDNRNSLDARALEAIGAQLDSVRGEFEAKGIATGSAEALRLFS